VIRILEEAFSRAVKEPTYIEWAKKHHVIVDPLSAQEFVNEVAGSYPKIEKLKEMLKEV
jgi:hypothetical protein